jgi:hypothetical protein
LWEIHSIIGTRKVSGVVHYWMDWGPIWMLESELGGAREFVDSFLISIAFDLDVIG